MKRRRASYGKSSYAARKRQANFRTGGFRMQEQKFIDNKKLGDSFAVSWAGGEMDPATVLSLNGCPQGDSESERIGRAQYVNSIYVKGWCESGIANEVTLGAAGGSPDAIVRIILLVDTQTNGAQLNAEDVMKTIATGEDVNSVRNLEFTTRFKILKDKTYKIPVMNGNYSATTTKFSCAKGLVPFKIGYKFREPMKVQYTGAGGDIANINDNSIHIIGTASTSTASKLTYNARCRYTG